jgi:putative acyl-CoA dehydrogenase
VVELTRAAEPRFHARRVAEDLAVALEASLLVRHAPPFVSDAYCAARLGPDRGRGYGTLPAGVDAEAIIERALPSE